MRRLAMWAFETKRHKGLGFLTSSKGIAAMLT